MVVHCAACIMVGRDPAAHAAVPEAVDGDARDGERRPQLPASSAESAAANRLPGRNAARRTRRTQ